MKHFKRLYAVIAVIVVFSFIMSNAIAAPAAATLNNAIKYTGADLKDPIDGMWQGFKTNQDLGGALESNQDGIDGDGTKLTLKGYNAGANAQYAYANMDELHNKMIKFKLKFDGELYDPEVSFITFVFRAAGYSSKIFWEESCYTLLLKGGKVEANKYPSKYQGVNNQLGGSKGNIPLLKKFDTPFAPGTYEIEVGALDGISPKTNTESVNLIMKINGKEVINVWDDSGRTPIIKRKGYFMVSLCATQKDLGTPDSRSSVTIYPVEEKAAGNTTATSKPDSTSKTTPTTSSNTSSNTPASPTDTKNNSNTTTGAVTAGNTPAPTPAASEVTSTPAPTVSQATSTPQAEETSATPTPAAAENENDGKTTDADSSGSNFPLIIFGIVIIVVLLGVGAFIFIRKSR